MELTEWYSAASADVDCGTDQLFWTKVYMLAADCIHLLYSTDTQFDTRWLLKN